MDQTISRLNIEHYRRKLATEQDETMRQTLMRLLAEEQAKLAALDNSLERRQPSSGLGRKPPIRSFVSVSESPGPVCPQSRRWGDICVTLMRKGHRKRIAAALTDEVTSADLALLIAEVEGASSAY